MRRGQGWLLGLFLDGLGRRPGGCALSGDHLRSGLFGPGNLYQLVDEMEQMFARKHDYRLGRHPPSFFRERLEQALQGAPRIYAKGEGLPGRQARKRTFEYALFDEDTGPFYFTLSILLDAGEPDEGALRLVRTVFDDLIRMDDEPGHQDLCNREQEIFLDAILNDRDMRQHVQDGINSLRIVLAADESVRTGEVVRL